MKKIIILLTIALIIFLIFYKPSPSINIEGEWVAQEIIFDDNKIFNHPKSIKINNWVDSLYILDRENPMKANLEIKYNNTVPYIIMSSNEKYLNGKFDFTIDTIQNIFNKSAEYTVDIKLKSNTTYLHLQRDIFPEPPKKFEFPKRGRP